MYHEQSDSGKTERTSCGFLFFTTDRNTSEAILVSSADFTLGKNTVNKIVASDEER